MAQQQKWKYHQHVDYGKYIKEQTIENSRKFTPFQTQPFIILVNFCLLIYHVNTGCHIWRPDLSLLTLGMFPIDNRINSWDSTLAHVMAWCRQATSHYTSQCWLDRGLKWFRFPKRYTDYIFFAWVGANLGIVEQNKRGSNLIPPSEKWYSDTQIHMVEVRYMAES